jgi:predicted DsbA family dithiol-disulfide isomerase
VGELAVAAIEQGCLFSVRKRLLERSRELAAVSDLVLLDAARDAGLDLARFREVRPTGHYRRVLERLFRQATALGVTYAPAMLLVRPYGQAGPPRLLGTGTLQRVLEDELARSLFDRIRLPQDR